MRHRTQEGSFNKMMLADGTRVYVYRWRERQPNGKLLGRKKTIGPLVDYPTQAKLNAAVAALKLNINADPTPTGRPRTFREVVEHYTRNELKDEGNKHLKFSSREGYRSYLTNHIVPAWGDWTLDEMDREAIAVEIENWLDSYTRLDGKPMSNGSKAKIRNIMSAVCTYAIRHRWLGRHNPLREVRQSAKRERVPEVLNGEELCGLYNELDLKHQVMLLLDVPTGMRRGEVLAVKWLDIDWTKKLLDIRRAVWHQRFDSVKNEASEGLMPLDDEMLADLKRWRMETPYAKDEDYIFASERMRGKQPLWPEAVIKNHFRPAAKRAGIVKHITWHSFRHSFSTLLMDDERNNVRTVQSMMRHSNARITLEGYTHAVDNKKRKAQRRVVEMIRPSSPAIPRVVENA